MALVSSSKLQGSLGLPIGSYLPMIGLDLVSYKGQHWLKTGAVETDVAEYPEADQYDSDGMGLMAVGDPVAAERDGIPLYIRIK